jgi:quercetin dioxygenase-like cupin family protein
MTAAATTKLEARSLNTPDETRTPKGATIQVNNLDQHSIGRFTFEPGWTWAESVKPVAGTDHCEKSHVGYCVSGQMEIWTPEGNRVTIHAGDAYTIPPGHDAKVVGPDQFVGIEFASADTYARK